MLRIQGQENDFVATSAQNLVNGFAGKGMPVAHRDKAVGVESLIPQFYFQRTGLPFRMPPDGRASADGGVVMLHFARACGRNEFGQRFAPDAGEREVNDIGIAEKVIKERLYRSQRIRTAQLKKNYSHTARCVRHPR
jgi:hypothetical protein